MKNFQRNLFVILAITLCGTCAYQWYLQATQMDRIEHLNQVVYTNNAAIQGYTNSMHDMDVEINQLHDRVTQLRKTAASNEQWAIGEKREVARLQSSSELFSNELSEYEDAFATLTNKLELAYDGERALAKQRDDFARRLNDSIKAQNELTGRYNQLVERINKLQSPTNASPAAAAP